MRALRMNCQGGTAAPVWRPHEIPVRVDSAVERGVVELRDGDRVVASVRLFV